jgi:hypothetical protein
MVERLGATQRAQATAWRGLLSKARPRSTFHGPTGSEEMLAGLDEARRPISGASRLRIPRRWKYPSARC